LQLQPVFRPGVHNVTAVGRDRRVRGGTRCDDERSLAAPARSKPSLCRQLVDENAELVAAAR
jgi:hypothetical protein